MATVGSCLPWPLEWEECSNPLQGLQGHPCTLIHSYFSLVAVSWASFSFLTEPEIKGLLPGLSLIDKHLFCFWRELVTINMKHEAARSKYKTAS